MDCIRLASRRNLNLFYVLCSFKAGFLTQHTIPNIARSTRYNNRTIYSTSQHVKQKSILNQQCVLPVSDNIVQYAFVLHEG